MSQYILSIDQGTTSTRTFLIDHDLNVKGTAQKEFKQHYPKPGWVEHNPEEIWASTLQTIKEALAKSKVDPKNIAAIGITNQRETTILWDRKTGKPVYNAIVWQCRRTAAICNKIKEDGYTGLFQKKTGLVVDAYFSGTKIKWLLDNVKGLRTRAEKGEICFGTVDTWLIWKLTGGKTHATDYTRSEE